MIVNPYVFNIPLVLAPMAGITDKPFRTLCRQLGADYCVSEMVTSRVNLWETEKTKARLPTEDEVSPRIIQIVGGDADLMAESAVRACDYGAELVDINMGCPAKKVCRKAAGSALLAEPVLVTKIIKAVVQSSNSPVTLKMRTGPSPQNRNGVTIAKIAESEGVVGLSIHGRSKNCRYDVPAEYATIADIKASVEIPVLVNGDIFDGDSARRALRETGADGLMIGRAAQGNPWVFSSIRAALEGRDWKPPTEVERLEVLLRLLESLYEHYGHERGSRVARKHLVWFLSHIPPDIKFPVALVKRLESSFEQMNFITKLKQQFEI